MTINFKNIYVILLLTAVCIIFHLVILLYMGIYKASIKLYIDPIVIEEQRILIDEVKFTNKIISLNNLSLKYLDVSDDISFNKFNYSFNSVYESLIALRKILKENKKLYQEKINNKFDQNSKIALTNIDFYDPSYGFYNIEINLNNKNIENINNQFQYLKNLATSSLSKEFYNHKLNLNNNLIKKEIEIKETISALKDIFSEKNINNLTKNYFYTFGNKNSKQMYINKNCEKDFKKSIDIFLIESNISQLSSARLGKYEIQYIQPLNLLYHYLDGIDFESQRAKRFLLIYKNFNILEELLILFNDSCILNIDNYDKYNYLFKKILLDIKNEKNKLKTVEFRKNNELKYTPLFYYNFETLIVTNNLFSVFSLLNFIVLNIFVFSLYFIIYKMFKTT